MSSAATTIDSKKPTTKQKIITANIRLLIEQLEAGHSEALTNYLTAMSRFHKAETPITSNSNHIDEIRAMDRFVNRSLCRRLRRSIEQSRKNTLDWIENARRWQLPQAFLLVASEFCQSCT